MILKTTSLTSSSNIFQLLIYAAKKDEIDRSKSDGNKINLSNPSVSKRFIGADYLILKVLKMMVTILKRISKPLKALIS